MKTGIYYDMPEDEYFAVPAISKSLIGKFLVSPVDAYRFIRRQADKSGDSKHLVVGSAAHKLILEGRKAFDDAYCKGFDKNEYPEALNTVAEIKAKITEGGEKPKGTKKTDLVAQCLEIFPEAQILESLQAEHSNQNQGKIELSPYDYDWITGLQWIKELLPGGKPEVSVFYEHPIWGLCKCRIDWLSEIGKDHYGVTDLKTFSNTTQKPVERAIKGDIASYGYHIQSWFYSMILEEVTGAKQIDFNFLFVEKERLHPNVLPVDVTTLGTDLGRACHNWLTPEITKLARCIEHYGYEKPWNEIHNQEFIHLESLPLWAFGD